MAETTNSPIPFKRLEQIASDACNSVLENVEFYEHPKTQGWNETIIQKILKALMSEATPAGADAKSPPAYKFAINSTIVQHVVPTSQLNKPTSTANDAEAAAAAKKQAGRRGMHSATGGYWNEKTDGMWSYKWDGDAKGLDVVLMLIWIAV
ncbi:Tctex-1 [Triangularia verruculosa]|uniref:Tctex-1 n=1 Tax=Triangularia verruculosa TaxID=2587418 RepID=A0AAN7ASG7_9PEZI|nr:Tctex-1 [Triangularia verruculosa]